MITRASVVRLRGSGRIGGFDVLFSGLFWIFWSLISFRKGGGGLGGEHTRFGVWVLFLGGVVSGGVARGSLFRCAELCVVFGLNLVQG